MPSFRAVAPASVTFTALDWSVPQTITVTGVNDFVDDGDIAYSIVTAAAVSADPNYAGVDPADASLGSAAWAEWVVDGDLAYLMRLLGLDR